MKKIILVFSLVGALLTISSSQIVTALGVKELSYVSKDFDFEFDYSGDLLIQEWKLAYDEVFALSIMPNVVGSVSSEVDITIFNNNTKDLATWIGLHEKDKSGNYVVLDPNILSTKELDNGVQLINSVTDGGDQRTRIVFVKGEYIWSVSYINTQDRNINMEKVYNNVLSTFKFSNESSKYLTDRSLVQISSSLGQSLVAQESLLINEQVMQTDLEDSGYKLPWPDGQRYVVTQGWYSSYTHNGLEDHAYDFGLGENTEVRASKAGVVSVIQSQYIDCGFGDHSNMANYVVINHPDDSTATLYLHLTSVSVSAGQTVSQGQTIGYSGATGWTAYVDENGQIRCGFHLHFQRQAQGSWHTQSQAIYFDEYPEVQLQEYTNSPLYTSQNYGVSTACGVNDVILINKNLYHNSFSCNALSSMRLLNSDINDSYVVLTVNNGGTIYLDPGTYIHDMNSEASFTARVNP